MPDNDRVITRIMTTVVNLSFTLAVTSDFRR